MTALPTIPLRMRVRVVMLDQRGNSWRVGVGLVAIGHIGRDLQTFADQTEAERAALDLADRLDLMAVRT